MKNKIIFLHSDLTWVRHFLLIVLLTLSLSGFSVSASQGLRYTAVIDAGSSGSRIHLYSVRAEQDFIKIESASLSRPNVRPGLSHFIQDYGRLSKNDAGESLRPMLDSLSDYLEKNNISKSQVPVYVLATSGMRRVALTHPLVSIAIFDSVQRVVQELGYSVGDAPLGEIPQRSNRTGIGILPGEFEALFAWEDVNYLTHAFHLQKVTNGIVEVGGSSAQVAYAVPNAFSSPAVITRKINGVTYRVLGLNYESAGLDAIVKTVHSSELTPERIPNPCYIRDTPHHDNKGLRLTNLFNYEGCVKRFSSAIEPLMRKNPPEPPGSGFQDTHFFGVGAIPAKLERWNIRPNTLPEKGDEIISRLLPAIQRACVPNRWETFLQWFNGPKMYSFDLCAHSTYLQVFLLGDKGSEEKNHQNSLNLRPDQLTVISSISGSITSWTRGLIVDLHAGK